MHRGSLYSLGEFGLIRRFAKDPVRSKNIILGIGDDAAIVRIQNGSDSLLTTDALIEGVHFDRRWDLPFDIGWKALTASLSDIAAMNGIPVASLLTIGCPARTSLSWLEKFHDGMRACGELFNVPLVGGDTVRTLRDIVASVTILGSVKKGAAVRRAGANVGDLIVVSGELGSCAAALDVVKIRPSSRAIASPAFHKHRRPLPRFDVLRRLRQRKIVPTSMIDISDGLVSDLQHIANSNNVRCAINPREIPLHSKLEKLAERLGKRAIDWALHSGEEYELVMTIAAKHEAAIRHIPSLTIIGVCRNGRGVADYSGKTPTLLVPQGFQHFRQNK